MPCDRPQQVDGTQGEQKGIGQSCRPLSSGKTPEYNVVNNCTAFFAVDLVRSVYSLQVKQTSTKAEVPVVKPRPLP